MQYTLENVLSKMIKLKSLRCKEVTLNSRKPYYPERSFFKSSMCCGFTLYHSDLIFYSLGHLLVKDDDFASYAPFCSGKIHVPSFAKFYNSWKERGIFIFNCIFCMLLRGHKVSSFLY